MRGMNGSGSSSSLSPSLSSPPFTVLHNYPLISAILAFAIAQSIKVFTTWYVTCYVCSLIEIFARSFENRDLWTPQCLFPGFYYLDLDLGHVSYKERRWDAKQLIGSGGMPSSHSATVIALAVAIGIQDGLGSSTFATAMMFASVVSPT
ncbi:hypothetical protein BHM03_00003709 [Ensete ventricosum]|uniref:Uncharacterized protein n=1 Tax=Ensete ventricosum TaxID=4639 RepID=A0A445MA54_ENSVE|nr:hypothetical protein BHM03_00003709 [Ensete ventricosum]